MLKNIQAVQDILSQINAILTGKQKRDAIIVLICMMIGSALELIGVSAIYPFLLAMLNIENLYDKWYIRWVYGLVPDIKITDVLLLLGGIIILIYILKNLFLVFNAYVQHRYAAKFRCEVATRMLGAYMKRPYQFFLNTNSGAIMRGITSDISRVYYILLYSITMCTELLTITVLGVFLFIIDWTLALSAMLLILVCFLTITLGFKGRIKKAGSVMWEAEALKNQYGYQAINGIKEIVVLNRRENFINQFNKAALLEQKSTISYGFIGACPDRILEGVCIGGFMGSVCIKIALKVDLNTFIPVVGAFAMTAFRILPSIAKISSRINAIVFYRPMLQNVYNNLEEVKEYEQSLEQVCISQNSQDDNIQFVKRIMVKNINWRYENSENDVLHNVTLYIDKGESVAFIGPSGAGKTTLADIIMGLLMPQCGSIEMDGNDIFSMLQQWSKIIGYVPQSVFLIDDTVRSNVAFGLEKDEISDEKVWAALEEAQLKTFVEKLPKGLDTIVGERGVKFSGGQRQRIAIARALYENPEILVLDEATSALDNETETAVMESIDALQGSKTLIIVAHRLTTIRNCDRIYEIKDGAAIERSRRDISFT